MFENHRELPPAVIAIFLQPIILIQFSGVISCSM